MPSAGTPPSLTRSRLRQIMRVTLFLVPAELRVGYGAVAAGTGILPEGTAVESAHQRLVRVVESGERGIVLVVDLGDVRHR